MDDILLGFIALIFGALNFSLVADGKHIAIHAVIGTLDLIAAVAMFVYVYRKRKQNRP